MIKVTILLSILLISFYSSFCAELDLQEFQKLFQNATKVFANADNLIIKNFDDITKSTVNGHIPIDPIVKIGNAFAVIAYQINNFVNILEKNNTTANAHYIYIPDNLYDLIENGLKSTVENILEMAKLSKAYYETIFKNQKTFFENSSRLSYPLSVANNLLNILQQFKTTFLAIEINFSTMSNALYQTANYLSHHNENPQVFYHTSKVFRVFAEEFSSFAGFIQQCIQDFSSAESVDAKKGEGSYTLGNLFLVFNEILINIGASGISEQSS